LFIATEDAGDAKALNDQGLDDSVDSNGRSVHGDVSMRLFDSSRGLAEDPDAALGINETVRGDWLPFAWDAVIGEDLPEA
jgi:hypothetical protein